MRKKSRSLIYSLILNGLFGVVFYFLIRILVAPLSSNNLLDALLFLIGLTLSYFVYNYLNPYKRLNFRDPKDIISRSCGAIIFLILMTVFY